MITVKVDMAMIDKKFLFTSEKTGRVYLDLVLKEYKEGEGKFGQSHYVNQSASKEHNAMLKETNGYMPIIGNATTYGSANKEKPKPAKKESSFEYDPSMKF